MNGRTPTKKESMYIRACIEQVGCIACILDGREIDNPGAWTEFHHDPDFGSNDPGCHFHGFGVCAIHHRGVAPAGTNLSKIAIRHPVASNCLKFSEQYGSDAYLCALVWERLPEPIKEIIGFDLSLGEIPASGV